MATYRTRDFEAALLRKGFRVDHSDHARFWFYLDGLKTSVVTRTSQGEREFDEFLFSRRRKQMHLETAQMRDFIECRLSASAYRRHLLDTGIVRLPEPPP